MTAEIIVLRVVHILGGIFWLGSGLFTSLFLMPALAASGPAAGPIMAQLQERRLFTVLPVAAVLTILSGARLMWITSGGFSSAYLASTMGRTLIASGIAAIIAFFGALVIARPAAVRAGRIGASLATVPDAERGALTTQMAALRRRSAIASTTAVALLVLSGAGMAVARYLR